MAPHHQDLGLSLAPGENGLQAAKIRIGTRGSPLALAQARQVQAPARRGARAGRGRLRARRHQDDRRPITRPAAGGGGRQGSLYQGDRGGAARGRDRPRRAFHEGHADRAAPRPRHRRDLGARGPARRLHQRVSTPLWPMFPPARRVGTSSLRRQAQVLHRRPDLDGRAVPRQRRDAAEEARRGPGRRHVSRLRRAQPAGSRPPHQGAHGHRRHAARGGAGRDRHRNSLRRHRHRAPRRAFERRSDRALRRGRARLPRQARRLVPHADRGPRRAARRDAALSRRDPHAGRRAIARDRAQRPSADRLAARRGGGSRASRPRRPRFFPRDRLMHVLITRPEPDASETRAQLEALGHDVSVEPLLRIEPLPIDAGAFEGAQALIATSRNGLRALAASERAAPRRSSIPIFTVGPGTAELARAQGFQPDHRGPRRGARPRPPHRLARRSCGRPARARGRRDPRLRPRGSAGGARHRGAHAHRLPRGCRRAPDPIHSAEHRRRRDRCRPLDVATNGSDFCAACGVCRAQRAGPPAHVLLSFQGVAEALAGLAPRTLEIAAEPNSAALLAAAGPGGNPIARGVV